MPPLGQGQLVHWGHQAFKVGFIEGRSTQQRIVAREDLAAMYASAKDVKSPNGG